MEKMMYASNSVFNRTTDVATCMEEQHCLAEFLRIICGLTDHQAAENARRIGDVISEEVFIGIRSFMQRGQACGQILAGATLARIYPCGTYRSALSLYKVDETVPRRLAIESSWLKPEAVITVDRKTSFHIALSEAGAGCHLYYNLKGSLYEALPGEYGLTIPCEAFDFCSSRYSPVIEAETRIALKKGRGCVLKERDLAVHLWQVQQ